jgi:hypothetical protein
MLQNRRQVPDEQRQHQKHGDSTRKSEDERAWRFRTPLRAALAEECAGRAKCREQRE